MAGRNAIANDEREKIRANDTQHATDGGADKPLKAHHAQPPLEGDDGDADQQANDSIQVSGQVKWMNEEADNSDDEDEQKTNKYDVHK